MEKSQNKASEKTYYWGRLNLIAAYTSKYDFLLTCLQSGAHIFKNNHDWGIFDVKEINIANYTFVVGHLVKYKIKKVEEMVDRAQKKLTATEIKDLAIAKSRFVLHIDSGLIAYHPISRYISDSTFRKVFSMLIEKARNGLLVNVEIQVISEEHDILKAIKEFDTIEKLSIYLHPSNPTFRHIWEPVDRELKELRAEKHNSSYFSKKGLNIDEKSSAYAKISMATDGYGKADLIGKKDQQARKASTEKLPVKTEIKDVGEHTEIENPIINKFKELWNRVKN